jgi:hypothetical protein
MYYQKNIQGHFGARLTSIQKYKKCFILKRQTLHMLRKDSQLAMSTFIVYNNL